MNLTLKPVKCKSISIRSGKSDACTFSLGDNILKSLKDAPEKFLGSNITFSGKSADIYEIVQSKLNGMIHNIASCKVREEFKLRVYTQYATPSIRYMLTVHELTDTQLDKLDHMHTNTIKSFLGLPSRGPTPAIIHSPDGLGFPKISDLYLESHTLAYARCKVKADDRVVHALKSKLNRESKWKRKKNKFGSNRWHEQYELAANQATANDSEEPKWSKVKQIVKNLVTVNRLEFWREYIKPLVQQGNMLKLIDLENMDLTWRSIIYDLPRGVLSFAVRSAIDYLPTFSNLKKWGKRSQTKCKLCGNYETLLHVLNNCSVSLNQGRYTWRHNSILKHTLSALKGFIESTNNDLLLFSDISGFTTTGGTLPVNVIVSKLKPDMVIHNKQDNSIHLVELTVPFEANIQKAHDRKAQKYRDLVCDISDNGFTCDLTCFEVGSRGLITPENVRNIDKIFTLVKAKPSKSFRKELSKLALLTSYTIWNARQEPAWGSDYQPLVNV